MKKPRPYQIKAVQDTVNKLMEQPGANPVVATPPGAGKSLLIAWTMRALTEIFPKSRFINITHVKELIEQDAKALEEVWPQARYGVYSAGLGSKVTGQPITIASIQSAYRNPDAFGRVSGIFVDEAHLISPHGETMYQKVLSKFREKNPGVFIAGYSATPWRMKHGKLTEGNIFNCVAFDNTQRDAFVELIDDAYLVPLIPKHTSFQFDVSKVAKVAGEFKQDELQAAVNKVSISIRALQEALQVAWNRKKWIIFCSGIAHVESVTEILQQWGERAVYVHSKMSRYDRDSAIYAYRQGDARMIVNDGILTTGFDAPWTDCIVLLKPTASPGLHVQILGRGIRPVFAGAHDMETVEGRQEAIRESGRSNCLVLDFAGNTMRLGPINDPVIPKKKGKGTGEVPVKICPCCGCYNHAAARFCEGVHIGEYCQAKKHDQHKHEKQNPCYHEFQFITKIEDTASTDELIARDNPILHWFKVDRVEYVAYEKTGSPPMMRVHYHCGIRRFTEYICIEHQNYAGTIARKWWRERLPQYPPPPTTADGLEFARHLKKAKWIYVHVNTKYPKIIAHCFEDEIPTYSIKMPRGMAYEVQRQ